jgi:hypothetical protein
MSPREYWGEPVAWLNPRYTGVAGGWDESKEHWGRPVTWLIPSSTGVDRWLG